MSLFDLYESLPEVNESYMIYYFGRVNTFHLPSICQNEIVPSSISLNFFIAFIFEMEFLCWAIYIGFWTMDHAQLTEIHQFLFPECWDYAPWRPKKDLGDFKAICEHTCDVKCWGLRHIYHFALYYY